jgi:DNA-binding CsgD family transcriptional regulator
VAASYLLLNEDGDVDTAHRLLVGAIRVQRYDASDTMLEEALHTLLQVCFFGGRAELWKAFHDALGRLAANVPTVLCLSGKTAADPVHTAAPVLGQLDAAVEGLAGDADPARIVRTAIAAVFVDRLAGCREALWRVVRNGREGGAVTCAINALILLGLDGFWTGQWDQARQLVDEGVRLCETRGYLLLAWPGRHVQATLAAARGDYDTTRVLTDQMLQWAIPRRARAVQWYAWQAQTLAALGRGDFEEAYQQATAISPAGVLASHVPFALYVPMDLVEAAIRTGRHAEAAGHVAAIRAANIAALSPRLALLAGGSAAIAAPDDSAARLFEEALSSPGADRWPFDLARLQLAYGEWLRRAQATTESRRHLVAALDTFERLGARPWAGRAASELRATGQTRPHAGERDHVSLTPQEHEIAMLAAAGLSNKQIGQRLFLSPRTVGGHLHRIFPKLGIMSRAALRDALDALGPEHERDRRS